MEVHKIEMPEELQVVARKDLGLPDGWIYKDIPSTTRENYILLFKVIGKGNFKIITVAKNLDNGTQRSQFFISPAGMENLRQKHNEH